MNDSFSALAQRFSSLVDERARRGDLAVPVCPQAFLALQRRISSQTFSLDDLARVVEPEPVLSAAVLRYANSAVFLGKEPVTTTRAAIRRLGTRELLTIAFTATLGQEARAEGPLSIVRRLIFQESLVAAILARDLAVEFGQTSEEAFVLGLLHDLGRLVALALVEQHMLDLDIGPSPPSPREWVTLFDTRHIELGVLLASQWSMPTVLVDVVGHHHDDAEPSPACTLLRFVDKLVCDLATTPSIKDIEIVGVGAGAEAAFLRRVHDVMLRLPVSVQELVNELRSPVPPRDPPGYVSLPPGVPVDATPTMLPITVVKGRSTLASRVVARKGMALFVSTPIAIEPNYMVRMVFEHQKVETTIHANVLSCERGAGGFMAELHPFALSRPQASGLDSVLKESAVARTA